ncbi:aspartyl/asparaginyl beta-hydroxylase domain-containing protein [Nitrospirillum sp. BR 11164]|uniref:aspartyl/asparaginyl beta-hydroxylase domain-containing protein n=1 Tax=Nitrospirillum sp. BR 11164 TaxID=3104324 RepID=UPI002AFE33E7|nr:aspartyl/asparaginyl beta-hydroxylase domain-containing protein [Nitrospirillum sp. BR 11164]MEA1650661.1 aspartyl/asparaginyl beta-hydroxylase domain-containing protein [Nitrospirillum sp. BR 11164]
MGAGLHPWQELTRNSGLTLHGPLDMAMDAAALQADFAVLDRDLPAAARASFGGTKGWTSVPLLDRRLDGAPVAMPALALMPSVAALLVRADWRVRACYLLRQGPGEVLKWHYDGQALHLEEARILIPIAVPSTAVTWIGHQPVAYPAGQGWAGDFSMPHQVENPAPEQRVVLALDVDATPALARLFPPALSAETARRTQLAQECCNLVRAWRANDRE